MAADSAITKIAKGKIVEVDQKEWRKVLMPMRVLPHLELVGREENFAAPG